MRTLIWDILDKVCSGKYSGLRGGFNCCSENSRSIDYTHKCALVASWTSASLYNFKFGNIVLMTAQKPEVLGPIVTYDWFYYFISYSSIHLLLHILFKYHTIILIFLVILICLLTLHCHSANLRLPTTCMQKLTFFYIENGLHTIYNF